jgi:hypothetical protein
MLIRRRYVILHDCPFRGLSCIVKVEVEKVALKYSLCVDSDYVHVPINVPQRWRALCHAWPSALAVAFKPPAYATTVFCAMTHYIRTSPRALSARCPLPSSLSQVHPTSPYFYLQWEDVLHTSKPCTWLFGSRIFSDASAGSHRCIPSLTIFLLCSVTSVLAIFSRERWTRIPDVSFVFFFVI